MQENDAGSCVYYRTGGSISSQDLLKEPQPLRCVSSVSSFPPLDFFSALIFHPPACTNRRHAGPERDAAVGASRPDTEHVCTSATAANQLRVEWEVTQWCRIGLSHSRSYMPPGAKAASRHRFSPNTCQPRVAVLKCVLSRG